MARLAPRVRVKGTNSMTDETPSDSMGAIPAEAPEEAPKPRRRRRTRAEIEAEKLAKAAAAESAPADGQPADGQLVAGGEPKPRRRRTSRKKVEEAGAAQAELPLGGAPVTREAPVTEGPSEEAPKPRRRRRTRAQIEADEKAKANAVEKTAPTRPSLRRPRTSLRHPRFLRPPRRSRVLPNPAVAAAPVPR